MVRPQKPRLVVDDVPAGYFKPQGIPLVALREVVLTLDGCEALRLVDAEGLDQQEAARRMGVSRSTLSRILAQARRTAAAAITGGLALRIEGGTVTRPRKDLCGHRPAVTGADDSSEGDTPVKTEGPDRS
ncbi:MAG: hypothetical protein H6Q99_659 [Proteobacteria bacterium]|nr:hypothetical protein [Pseudomonadota bacterium]